MAENINGKIWEEMIYHLEVEARFCTVHGLLNGFPAYNLDGTHPSIFSRPINASLIGKQNILDFQIVSSKPFDPKHQYSITGCVKLYSSGTDMTGPDQGRIVTQFSHENLPAARIMFNNESFDYSNLLTKGQKIEDKENIFVYAEYLKNILKEKNIMSILQEFDPK